MKKLILFVSAAFMFISCSDDDYAVKNEKYISALKIESSFASIDKNEIPVDFTFYSTSDVESVTINIDFDGEVKLNGNIVNGNFQYHINDDVTLTPNEYGRTKAIVSLPEHGTFSIKDFYTIESNGQPYVFVNNLINRAPEHSNGKIYYETTDGNSYSVNKVQLVVLSAQPYEFTIDENNSILNSSTSVFQGSDLLSTFELGLKDQNYGSNSFKFNFVNGHEVEYPFNYVKTYIK
ncbi:hypothetical protein MG290_14595 (plasmid) [Flavobacterium sp. CBA20B-1]|uniref:hypothetical protein n=1 Tax=unclassified Flavobacterium TaxID=196869 RepID=UPI0022243CAB|nr:MULTISPECIES: hypothetical protein [unclassified Flavobacterium]WCM43550.1 hypothetical protein MG290_14595 [Flavobacterium sp. CBA20B-1]